MPRLHQRKLGSRRYADYSKEELEECLNHVREGKLSQRTAAKQFNIPRSTLKNKLKQRHSSNVGRQTVFSAEEEAVFEAHIAKIADYLRLSNY